MTWARVQSPLGLKPVSLVPAVMPFSTAQSTAFQYQALVFTSSKGFSLSVGSGESA